MRLLVLVLVLGLAAPAAAQSVDALTAAVASETRERASAERMAAGLLAGVISSGEERRLVRLLTRLRAYQETVYADGAVTRREQIRLDRMHARLEAAIADALER